MQEILTKPWPSYISGAAIALIMLALIYFGKSFGFSSNLRTICSMAGAGKRVKFFDTDWRAQRWNLLFLLGSILGGYIAANFLKNDTPILISSNTIQDIENLGIHFDGELNPSMLFGWEAATSPKGFLLLIIGGILIGFGTRYAAGCTSGHGISGLSNLQLPSLIAIIGFFIGGLIMTHLLFPIIF